MSIYNVRAGVTSTGLSINFGDVLGLSTGGNAVDIVVNNGGVEDVNLGSTATGTILNRGGSASVNSKGTTVGTVVNGGIEALFGGGLALGTTVTNGGTQRVRTGGTASGTVVSSGGVQQVDTSGNADHTIVGNGGTQLVLLNGVASGTVLQPGGTIDLAGLSYVGGSSSAVIDLSNDILTVTEGNASYSLQLSGNYAGTGLGTAPDGGNGTLVISDAAACYCSGTMIQTDQGEVPVEVLREGDLIKVLTSHGPDVRPVVWLGHRRVDCLRHIEPAKVWPVRICTGAFGGGQPHRDLWLSPEHAVFVEDVLIPVKHLINGTSIVQVPRDRVIYYHVELSEHSILMAEGLPAESYLDTGNRSDFENAETAIRLFPEFSSGLSGLAVWDAYGRARLVITGPELETTRRRLAKRAQRIHRQPANPGWVSRDTTLDYAAHSSLPKTKPGRFERPSGFAQGVN